MVPPIKSNVRCLQIVLRPTALAIFLAALVAQSSTADEPTDQPAGALLPRRLTLVARTGPDLEKPELEIKLKNALKFIDAKTDKVHVVAISRASYAAIERLVRDVGQADDSKSLDVKIEPCLDKGATWEIDTGDPAAFMESLQLTTKSTDPNDKAEKTEELKQQSLKDKDWRLAFHSPGRWLLHLDEGRQLLKCVVNMGKAGGQTVTKVVTLKDGEQDRYWIIAVHDYVGSEDKLFEALKNERAVKGNPFTEIEKPELTSIILANMAVKSFDEGIAAGGTTYDVFFERPGGIEPPHVWLYFPLTAQQRDDYQKEIADKLKHDVYGKLGGLIHEHGVTATGEAPEIAPGSSQPNWYEVSWDESTKRYHRTFKLADKSKWKAGAVYGLVVYASGGSEDYPYSVNHLYLPVHDFKALSDAAAKSAETTPPASNGR